MWSRKPVTNANVARRTQKLLRYAYIGNPVKTAEKLAGLGPRVAEGLEAINAENDPSDRTGKTPLIHAIAAGSYETVKALLESGANPNNPGGSGMPPIIWAYNHRQYKIAQLLFTRGVDVNKVQISGSSIIFAAIAADNIELIKILLAAKINLHIVNRYNYTPLLWAVRANNPVIVQMLLTAGANPNVVSPGDFISPLMMTHCDATGLEIIDMLIAAGARTDKSSGKGQTALFRAALEDDTCLPKIKKLISHGAAVDAADPTGATPLTGALTNHAASMGRGHVGNLELIKYLWTFPSEHKNRLIHDMEFRHYIFDQNIELLNAALGLSNPSALPEAQSGLILVFDLDNTIYDAEDFQDYKPLKIPCVNKRIERILTRAAALRGRGVDAICMLTNNASYDFIQTVDRYFLELTQSVGKFTGVPEANPAFTQKGEREFVAPGKIFSAVNPDGRYFFDYILTRLADVRKFDPEFIRTHMTYNILCNSSYPGTRDPNSKRMVDIEYMAHKVGVPISSTHPEEDIMRRTYFFDDLDIHTVTQEMKYMYEGKYKDHFIHITPAFTCGMPDKTDLSKLDQLLTNLETQTNAKPKNTKGGKRKTRRKR